MITNLIFIIYKKIKTPHIKKKYLKVILNINII